MPKKEDHKRELRLKLITEIESHIEVLGSKTLAAKLLGMSWNNLDRHLNIDGPYTDNVKKLMAMLEQIAAHAKAKMEKDTEAVNKLIEKVNS